MDTPTPSKDLRRRDHALHNETVCFYLAEREEFGDWVTTTAFYSALHWMHYKLFPLSVTDTGDRREVVFRTLDEYRAYAAGNVRTPESKHRTLLGLVLALTPSEVASEYRRLFDLCMSARYRDYRTAPAIIGVVQSGLKVIRTYCDRDETGPA